MYVHACVHVYVYVRFFVAYGSEASRARRAGQSPRPREVQNSYPPLARGGVASTSVPGLTLTSTAYLYCNTYDRSTYTVTRAYPDGTGRSWSWKLWKSRVDHSKRVLNDDARERSDTPTGGGAAVLPPDGAADGAAAGSVPDEEMGPASAEGAAAEASLCCCCSGGSSGLNPPARRRARMASLLSSGAPVLILRGGVGVVMGRGRGGNEVTRSAPTRRVLKKKK